MINRLVKMSFKPEECDNFLHFFSTVYPTIKEFEGCIHLELWRGTQEQNVFFTYSVWQSEHHLNQYRFSEFFKKTWDSTRVLFNKKAEAISCEKVYPK